MNSVLRALNRFRDGANAKTSKLPEHIKTAYDEEDRLYSEYTEMSVQLLYLNYVTVIRPCTGYLVPDIRSFKIFIPFE